MRKYSGLNSASPLLIPTSKLQLFSVLILNITVKTRVIYWTTAIRCTGTVGNIKCSSRVVVSGRCWLKKKYNYRLVVKWLYFVFCVYEQLYLKKNTSIAKRTVTLMESSHNGIYWYQLVLVFAMQCEGFLTCCKLHIYFY